MRDLGSLSGDDNSAGLAINERGDVVGASIQGDVATGSPRAFVRRHEDKMRDLNTLVPKDTPLFLLTAFGINDEGEIAGFGVQIRTGEIHAFLAIPCDDRS
jgi:probable HAF family extracellular repeat protein